MRFMTIALISCGLLIGSLSGCYRVPVPQGNSLSSASLNRLHVGMSSAEVRNAIGDPVLTNVYSSDQLVYVYSYKALWQSIKIRRLFLHFDHDRLSRWDVSSN